jgi:hypothetical protein
MKRQYTTAIRESFRISMRLLSTLNCKIYMELRLIMLRKDSFIESKAESIPFMFKNGSIN